jgi:lipoyl(octanoyl) transferase
MNPDESAASQFCQRRRTVFERILVINDFEPRTAAMHMAIDHALLESTQISSVRFYHWSSPALSFGYGGKFADVSPYAAQRDLVRRWTGGGVVFHGQDLTYSIAIPVTDLVFNESAVSIYEKIHLALRNALVALGQNAVVAMIGDHGRGAATIETGSNRNANYNGHCFANPVHADVLLNGRKIAGAAQRRTRSGLLQQGSVQGIDLSEEIRARFAGELSMNCVERKIDIETVNRARDIATWKYGTEEWLRRR